MVRGRLLALLAFVALLAGCMTAGEAGDVPARLGRAQIDALGSSVFEIVVPKRDENNIVYAGGRTLPVEELPFTERNDKFYSIGTAFVVAPGKLVSAAHVFQLDRFAIDHDYFVRDQTGKVHQIALVRRYSQYRDLVEFSLVTEPAKMKPLKASERIAVGDTVYTVGNANGEGIALRAGQIASFTFEPVNGQWKDVRYSAPASPGNSGGPLLNTRGEVIGVVVRKNASENLNVAIPIGELRNLSAHTAEFFVPSSEVAKDGEATRDWRYKTRVPATLDKLAKKAEADRRRFHLKQWARVQAARRNQTFPKDPVLQDYVWNQTYTQHVQMLSYDDKTGYFLRPAEPASDFQTARGETVYTLVDEPDFSLVQIEVPGSAALTDYVKKPELLLDAVIEAFAMYREFNGRRIPLKSMGAPAEAAQFTDALGRTWLTAVWRSHFNQGTTLLNCLPAPLGFGCRVDLIDTADETLGLREKFERYHANEVALSYWGDMNAWARFQDLPKRYLPKVLQSMRIDRKTRGQVALESRDIHLNYPQPLFDDKSWLFLGVGYGMSNALEPEIQFVKLEHGPEFRVSEVFEAIIEPPRGAPGEDKSWLSTIMAKSGKLSGKPTDQDGQNRVFKVLGVRNGHKGRHIVNTVSCGGTLAAPEEKSVESTCKNIGNVFKPHPKAH